MRHSNSKSAIRRLTFPIVLIAALLLGFENAALAQDQPTIVRGEARITNPGLTECGGRGSRVSATGEVVDQNGVRWKLPAPVTYSKPLFADDLHNRCSGKQYASYGDLDLSTIPVRTTAGGKEIFTAIIFADNYFEFRVNGKILAVDPVPFTPFNSNVIRFTAERPFTIAAMLVDWEESLGIGTESNRGNAHHPGDGGFVAVIKDAAGKTVAVTDETWRAQTYYIAPLESPECLKINGALRDSRACSSASRQSANGLSAAHWPVPDNWSGNDFNDSQWPQATVFSNDTVGVDNKRSYTNFRSIFDAPGRDAKFIWSPNLVLDNLVLVRKTIR